MEIVLGFILLLALAGLISIVHQLTLFTDNYKDKHLDIKIVKNKVNFLESRVDAWDSKLKKD